MKTMRLLALTLLLFLLPLATATADGGFTPQNIWVAVSNLPQDSPRVNLRSKPSANAEVMDVCMSGTEVILMGFTDDWAHVIAGDQTGFLPVANLR